VPAGWIAQFDQNSQRWYYVEQATGRSQWEAPQPPAMSPPPPGPPAAYAGYSGYNSSPMPNDPSKQGMGAVAAGGKGDKDGKGEDGKDKKKDKSNLLLGAAGGLAVGAIGGALIANKLGMCHDPSVYYQLFADIE
jgi:hypothetical protein